MALIHRNKAIMLLEVRNVSICYLEFIFKFLGDGNTCQMIWPKEMGGFKRLLVELKKKKKDEEASEMG